MVIRLAVTGTGYIANIHAQAIKVQREAELVAVVNRASKSLHQFVERFGVSHQYETVTDLLNTGSVEALIVCTPNYLHAPQTIAALEAGVHVMVEKPMAMDAKESKKMIKAGLRSGALLMVAHCWRFDEDVLWLRSQVGKLGKIIRTKSYGVHVNWGPSGWFTQKKFSGGGALADMGIHAIDTARFLLGDPDPISVYGRVGTYYKQFDVDDTGVIMVNWDNGAVSYIESGWWQPHSDGPEACTQVYGVNGFGQLYPTRLHVGKKKIEADFAFPRPEHAPQGMYNAQMAYFLDCIHKGRTPMPGGAEGLTNMLVVDAAYKSARTGKVATL